MPMPPVKIDRKLNEGDILEIGEIRLDVWHTPGHTPGQLAFPMGELILSGDNLYKDGCVGVIDAHHGSNLGDFVKSLERLRDRPSAWMLPSHGPMFPHDPAMIQKTIERLTGYMHMADFGTCAIDWPLQEEWEDAIIAGWLPGRPA
jgi:hydroxyacylglutathione hydrolase